MAKPPVPVPRVHVGVLGDLGTRLSAVIAELPVAVGIAHSGGLDSGLLHHLLRSRPGDRSVAVTVGFPGRADPRAVSLGPRDTIRELDDPLVLTTLQEVRDYTGLTSVVELSFEVPILLAVRALPPGPVVVGQGADELFCGYARYADLSADEKATRSKVDLAKVLDTVFPREQAMAARTGHRLIAPYLDPGFIASITALEPDTRFPLGNKGLLRALAIHLGLAAGVARRPKQAAQYGSGVVLSLRRSARRKGLTLRQLGMAR